MDRKQYTVEERVKIVEAYFELKSITHTQRRFTTDFPGRSPQVDSQSDVFCRSSGKQDV